MLVPSFEFTKGKFCERFPNEVEIEPCSLTLVCGNSGSGKSLFINYLAKLDSIKDDVYVSQTNSYPPLNYKVSEIISFLSVRQNSLDEFLNYIKPYFNLRPFLKKRLSKLSGGEKSFINLISSLFSSKNIIILDEPLNMISEENRKKAAELILEVSKYKTIFIVSHFREIFTDISDYVIEFKDGLGTVIKSDYKEKIKEKNIQYKSIRKLSGKRTRRYLKDDLPLIALFFVFTLCIQFILFFSVAKTQIDKKVYRVEDTIYGEYVNSLSFNPGHKKYEIGEEPEEPEASLSTPVKQENFGFEELIEVGKLEFEDESTEITLNGKNRKMYKHILFLTDIENIQNYTNEYVYSYDYSHMFLRNNDTNSAVHTFHIGVAKDYCIGKCENLEEDEIIVGKNYFEDYDFSTPIKAKYVYNPNWKYNEGESESDINSRKWLAPGAIIKDIKIVGRDSYSYDEIILPDIREKPYEKLFNYLGTKYKESDNKFLLNNTNKDTLTLVNELNKRLIEEKGIHNRAFGLYYREPNKGQYIRLYGIGKMMSFDTLYDYIKQKKNIVKSASIGFYTHDIDIDSLKEKKLKFVKDDSYVFKTFKAKLNRKFNSKTDIILPYTGGVCETGKKIELMGKSFTLYGCLKSVKNIAGIDWFYESDYIFGFDQIENFKRPKNIISYEEYNHGSITSVTLSYDSPQKAIVEQEVINKTFIEDNPYLDSSTANITKERQKVLNEYFIDLNNHRKVTSYIALTLLIIGIVGFIGLSFVFYFVFKKNYKVNRYKKRVSRRNVIVPSVVSIISILLVALTCYMKSIPYYVCSYYFESYSLDNELANKIQNQVNIIGLVLISIIAIYLYLRNISFSKKKKIIKNKSK